MALSRTIERVGLVAVGVLVGASGLAIIGADDRVTDTAGGVTAGLTAPELLERAPGDDDEADRDADTDDASLDSSEVATTTADSSEAGSSETADERGGSVDDDQGDTEVLDRSADFGPISDGGDAQATAGAVSAIVVELAPATKVFGSKEPPPTTTTTAPPASTTTVPPVTTTTVRPRQNGRTVEGAEWRLLNGINSLRNRSGVNGVSMNETARDEARRWSKYMAENNIFDHRPDITSGVVWTNALGENVATGGQITDIHLGLWNSQGHRDNILSVNFTEVGIGVWYDARTGKFWVTEIFVG